MDTYDQASGDILLLAGGARHFTPHEHILFDHLLRIKPGRASWEGLAFLLYHGRDGPTDESRCIRQFMCRIKEKLKDASIQLDGGRGWKAGYGLTGDVRVIKRPPRQGICPCCGQTLPADG